MKKGRNLKMLIFDEIYKIMSDSFPTSEIRSYEMQKALLNRSDYHIKTYKQEGIILGFCAYYQFEDFFFIENLACTPESRGLGIGSKLVREVLEEANDRLVLLEVEIPQSENEKRRVKFYERLGFYLNPHYHYLPSLNEFTTGMELKIMSYNKMLTKEEQQTFRRLLNRKVYHVDEDYKI